MSIPLTKELARTLPKGTKLVLARPRSESFPEDWGFGAPKGAPCILEVYNPKMDYVKVTWTDRPSWPSRHHAFIGKGVNGHEQSDGNYGRHSFDLAQCAEREKRPLDNSPQEE